MVEKKARHDLSPEGADRIDAIDDYLEETIRGGSPIEALIATRRLGEIASNRAKEAARAATEGSWSWTDVGRALGMTRQAAHEKLRARVRGDLDKARSKLERAEEAGHAKIVRRADRGRKKLDRVPPFSPKVDSARERIDEWEQRQHDKLNRSVGKAQQEIAGAEQRVREKLDRKV